MSLLAASKALTTTIEASPNFVTRTSIRSSQAEFGVRKMRRPAPLCTRHSLSSSPHSRNHRLSLSRSPLTAAGDALRRSGSPLQGARMPALARHHAGYRPASPPLRHPRLISQQPSLVSRPPVPFASIKRSPDQHIHRPRQQRTNRRQRRRRALPLSPLPSHTRELATPTMNQILATNLRIQMQWISKTSAKR